METTLDTYAAPIDPAVPLICFDEAGTALQSHAHAPLPARPGDVAREDPEYGRHGSANLFMAYAPHLGWRNVTVTTPIGWLPCTRRSPRRKRIGSPASWSCASRPNMARG